MKLAALFLVFVWVATLHAARTFNGSSAYISAGNPSLLPGTSYTVAAWGRPLADNQQLVAWRSSITAPPIKLQLDLSSGSARFLIRDDANVPAFSSKASAYSAGTWTHFAGVRTGNDALVYVDGVAGTLATGSVGTITVNSLDIGAFNTATGRAGFWNGDVAEVAIWSAALDAAEIAALARGISPLHVRLSALVFWAPLWPGLQEPRGGVSLTDNGPSTAAAHPRIYR